MANNFDSNITRKLARVFLEKFESMRVLSKNVNTQLLTNAFNPSTGDTVDFKRPTDYTTFRNNKGDLTAHTADDIITGKASGVVQDYFSVLVEYDEVDEALKMDQLDQLLAPMATRVVTDFELDFADHMLENSGLSYGTYGTAADTWDDIAGAGSTMEAFGIPMDEMWKYVVNPYTQRKLASTNRSLGAGGEAGSQIADSNSRATIMDNFAGMRVMTATTLGSYTSADTSGDRAGAINGTMDVSYVTHKDTMQQDLTIDGIGSFAGSVPAGTQVEITGLNQLNMSTRQPVIDDTGANVLWRGTVVEDSANFTAGAGTIKVSGPALFEAGGAYNTVDRAIADNDVITLLGADDTLYQPNLFFHPQAFSVGSVPIKKLHSTDILATTEDGLQIRVSKGADFTLNRQMVRFDFHPAYATLNPFFAGQGWGV